VKVAIRVIYLEIEYIFHDLLIKIWSMNLRRRQRMDLRHQPIRCNDGSTYASVKRPLCLTHTAMLARFASVLY